LRRALFEPARARTAGARGRAHVLVEARGPRPPRPAPAPATRGGRPVVVLEAPLFEVSSSALLTIATARALLRRDRVHLHLLPRGEHHVPLARLRAEAPDVAACLVRQPPARVDLWLSAGWPPRAARPPQARTFALRLDWEYGALPAALTPLVLDDTDVVVVHSRAVHAAIAAAGRPERGIALVPHGVDGALFSPAAAPLAEVVTWKRDRIAILFVGGLIWRKGIDLRSEEHTS